MAIAIADPNIPCIPSFDNQPAPLGLSSPFQHSLSHSNIKGTLTQTMSPTSHRPSTLPVPKYVMTKAYLHRDLLGDTGSRPPTSGKKRKKISDDNQSTAGPIAAQSSTQRATKPKHVRQLPMIAASISTTTAPNTLPLPPPPTFAICVTPISVNNPSATSEPPLKKQKTKAQSTEALAHHRAAKHAKRDTQPCLRGLKDIHLKHLAKTKVLMLENFHIADAPCGTGGWQGSSHRTYHAPQSLAKALVDGFKEVEWDGLQTLAILDRQRHLIMLFWKCNTSKEGIARQDRMTMKMEEAASKARLNRKTAGKGDFYALRKGIIPSLVSNGIGNTKVMQELLDDTDFKYEARESDIVFRMYNPNMHSAYWDIREAVSLGADTQHLKWNFNELPFALTTFNFGPQPVCETHIDNTNNTYGWAPVRAFGHYDYTKGGHILFPSLKLVIQFPPGTESWFPTALFPHANTLIAPDECRYSVTLYNSGCLSQWVYHGAMSKRGWLAYLKKHSKTNEEAALDAERPRLLLQRMFPTWT